MLDINNCTVSYDKKAVFRNLSIKVGRGETAAVIGPSGCGKSTFLSISAGLKKPDCGKVMIDNVPVYTGDRRIGLILQSYGLFPWMSVEENASLPLKIQKKSPVEIEEIIHPILERLDLINIRKKYPSKISGGEKQRVAIARTLSYSPDVLLMDEPFSALDAITRESLQDLLIDILAEKKIISIIVTHSIEEAVFLSSSVYIMGGNSKEGFAARVENPFQEGGHSRKSDSFFKHCIQVREIMAVSYTHLRAHET